MSAAARYDFDFPQGDSVHRTLEFYDPAGNPIDLTGYVVEMQMRRTPLTPSPLLTLDNGANGGVTFPNGPAGGIAYLDITPEQAAALPIGTYSYAIKAKLGTTFAWTPIWGYFTVYPETAQ